MHKTAQDCFSGDKSESMSNSIEFATLFSIDTPMGIINNHTH